MSEFFRDQCLSCGGFEMKIKLKPILYERDGVEFWIPSKCYECQLCNTEFMNGEMMDQFRNKVKVAVEAVEQEGLPEAPPSQE